MSDVATLVVGLNGFIKHILGIYRKVVSQVLPLSVIHETPSYLVGLYLGLHFIIRPITNMFTSIYCLLLMSHCAAICAFANGALNHINLLTAH